MAKTSIFWGPLYHAVHCEPGLRVEGLTLTYNDLLLHIVTWMENGLVDTLNTSSYIYLHFVEKIEVRINIHRINKSNGIYFILINYYHLGLSKRFPKHLYIKMHLKWLVWQLRPF